MSHQSGAPPWERGEAGPAALQERVRALQDQPILLDPCQEGRPLRQVEDPQELHRDEHYFRDLA